MPVAGWPFVQPGEVVGHRKRNMLLAQNAEQAPISGLPASLPSPLAAAQQQHAGCALLSYIEVAVTPVPFEYRLGRQQSAAVFLVESATATNAGPAPWAMF